MGPSIYCRGEVDLNSKDDNVWKIGIIYFNPENSKVLVPKRIGIGWTLNFARWQSWLFILVLLSAALISVIRSITQN